jgi:hypothetical protein
MKCVVACAVLDEGLRVRIWVVRLWCVRMGPRLWSVGEWVVAGEGGRGRKGEL